MGKDQKPAIAAQVIILNARHEMVRTGQTDAQGHYTIRDCRRVPTASPPPPTPTSATRTRSTASLLAPRRLRWVAPPRRLGSWKFGSRKVGGLRLAVS